MPAWRDIRSSLVFFWGDTHINFTHVATDQKVKKNTGLLAGRPFSLLTSQTPGVTSTETIQRSTSDLPSPRMTHCCTCVSMHGPMRHLPCSSHDCCGKAASQRALQTVPQDLMESIQTIRESWPCPQSRTCIDHSAAPATRMPHPNRTRQHACTRQPHPPTRMPHANRTRQHACTRLPPNRQTRCTASRQRQHAESLSLPERARGSSGMSCMVRENSVPARRFAHFHCSNL